MARFPFRALRVVIQLLFGLAVLQHSALAVAQTPVRRLPRAELHANALLMTPPSKGRYVPQQARLPRLTEAQAAQLSRPRPLRPHWLQVSGFAMTASGVVLAAFGGNMVLRYAYERNQRDSAQSWQSSPNNFESANRNRSERGWLLTGIGSGILLGGVFALSIAPNREHRVVTLAPRFSKRSVGLTVSAAF